MNINLTLIAQAIAFAALIWLVATKIWPPLLAAIEERQYKIAEGLAAADNSQKALAEAVARAIDELKAARSKANEIIEQAHQRANQIVEAARHEAIEDGVRQKAIDNDLIAADANLTDEEIGVETSATRVETTAFQSKKRVINVAH